MGMCKVVKVSDRKVKFVHQLNSDGSPYAEDVTVELQDGVDASRLSYLVSQDGQIGTINFSFSRQDLDASGLKFPE